MGLQLVLVLVSLIFGSLAADDQITIEPWHLDEHSAGLDKKSLVVHFNQVLRKPTPRASDGGLFHYTVPERRPPRKYDSTPTQTNPQTSFGAKRPTVRDTGNATVDNALTVAAYYYPWYDKDFHGGKYIRGQLDPPQYPVLGEYSDRNPEVIAQHIKWSREAGIDLWVSSWWGPDSGTDITIRDVIQNHPELGDLKFCLFYETMGRVDVNTLNTSKVYDDIAYAAKTYFRHPNYYTINGRPVMFVYLTRVLERLGILEQVVAMMRTAAYHYGHLIYIAGDQAFGNPPKTPMDAFDWLDAVTNYDIFGDMGRPSGHATLERVANYSSKQAEWRKAADAQGCAYIPGATPGYNDKAVREAEYNAMSRKLDKRLPDGSLFAALLQEGKKLVHPLAGNSFVVNSFNEWHEDTQIEPVGTGTRTYKPWKLTRGYVYRGYGELYLRILHRETKDQTSSRGRQGK